ncbi:MAG TPA: hypothetical protein VH328_17145 [Burkholderiaceae bacterium]|nr:hypothetical protein [Burkholderiaceae bacterium]
MTSDLHHRRLRETRGTALQAGSSGMFVRGGPGTTLRTGSGATLRAVGVSIALAGGLGGGIGLQMAGAPLQARMASLANGMLGGRPSLASTLAARGPADAAACPDAGVPTRVPGAPGASTTASMHHRVHVAAARIVAPNT